MTDFLSLSPAALAHLVELGRVGRAHGLGGAFFVAGRGEPIPRAFKSLLIGSTPGRLRRCDIQQSTMQSGRPLLKCTLAGDRTAAEALTGATIYVERVRLDDVEGDELHWDDLAGVEVRDKNGVVLGVIDHVYNAGASDIVAIVAADGRSVDVALVDDFVDLDAGLATSGDGKTDVLVLLVSADTFAELWQEAPK